MPSPRVIFGFESEAGTPSGIKRYSQQLRQAMQANLPQGAELWHDTVSPGRRSLVAESWSRGILLPSSAEQHEGATSVHAVSLLAPLSSRALPCVVTVHDLVPITHPETLTKRGVAWHRRLLGRAVTHAAAIAVPSQATAEQLIRHFDGPRLKDRIHLLPGAASLPPANTSRWPGKPTGAYVVHLGTLEPRKRIDAIIAAVALMSDVTLVLVGHSGWGNVSPATLAARWGLSSDRLIQVSGADDQLAANIVSGADALIVASDREGFGLPLVEAMALGTPIIYSDDPALVEVAAGAGTCVARNVKVESYAAEIRDAIQASQKSRSTLAAAGLRRSAQFSWAATASSAWKIHAGLD